MDSGAPFAALLVGQPTQRQRPRLGVLAALDQRIAVRCIITGMSPEETSNYLTLGFPSYRGGIANLGAWVSNAPAGHAGEVSACERSGTDLPALAVARRVRRKASRLSAREEHLVLSSASQFPVGVVE